MLTSCVTILVYERSFLVWSGALLWPVYPGMTRLLSVFLWYRADGLSSSRFHNLRVSCICSKVTQLSFCPGWFRVWGEIWDSYNCCVHAGDVQNDDKSLYINAFCRRWHRSWDLYVLCLYVCLWNCPLVDKGALLLNANACKNVLTVF